MDPTPIGAVLSSLKVGTEAPTPRRTEGERKVLVGRLAAQLGERYGPGVATLSNYVATTPRQKAVLARCDELRDRLGELTAAGRGLVWCGSIGTGKDHLMAALLYAAAWRGGLSCCWTPAEELFAKLRDAMDSDRTEANVLRPFVECDVLAVSDPLPVQGNLGDWQARTFGRLIDLRYRRRRPVWLTANAADQSDLHERLTPPVADRLLEGAVVLQCFWPSHRPGAVAE
jgi:DNA replication protein DnaC